MRWLAVVIVSLFVVVACRAVDPSNRVVAACETKCNARISRNCSEQECNRGCEFILDRLVERETDQVLACVGKRARRCSDVVWAECAATIGEHADGGPPAPSGPKDDW